MCWCWSGLCLRSWGSEGGAKVRTIALQHSRRTGTGQAPLRCGVEMSSSAAAAGWTGSGERLVRWSLKRWVGHPRLEKEWSRALAPVEVPQSTYVLRSTRSRCANPSPTPSGTASVIPTHQAPKSKRPPQSKPGLSAPKLSLNPEVFWVIWGRYGYKTRHP